MYLHTIQSEVGLSVHTENTILLRSNRWRLSSHDLSLTHLLAILIFLPSERICLTKTSHYVSRSGHVGLLYVLQQQQQHCERELPELFSVRDRKTDVQRKEGRQKWRWDRQIILWAKILAKEGQDINVDY